MTLEQLDLKSFVSIEFDSRRVQKNSLFVAIRGTSVDGHDFFSDVIGKGATGLVVEDRQNVPAAFKGVVVIVPNTRRALDELATRFYGNPADSLFCVGVTGTNGKTTTTYIIEFLLNQMHMPTGVVGTIDQHLQGHVWASTHTTPDALALQSRLRDFVDLGAKALAMEVSSHALSQARVESVPFRVAVFTNLTRDHLDYHKDMQGYFAAKARLFQELLPRFHKGPAFAIVHQDDEYGRNLQIPKGVQRWSYGSQAADFKYQIIRQDFSGTTFQLQTPVGSCECHVPLVGLYNVANATAALAVAIAAGGSLQSSAQHLQKFPGVPGRLQSVPNSKGLHVFVDYAHTDDALKTVLTSLQDVRREAQWRGRIRTVFGCGGDRDKGKRPLMLRAALDGSDDVFLTSDNPRSEDPKSIVQDVLAGASENDKTRVHIIVDRRQAIQQALQSSLSGDVILIAGKGHETYQQVGDRKITFNDVAVAEEFLK